MTLIKFRSLNEDVDLSKIKDIIKNGFYCSSFLDFNDMNEGIFPKYITPHIINKDKDIDVLSQKEQYKICSFSELSALNSQLMWGHYASAGRGVAIEVEIYESMKKFFEAVNYYSQKEDKKLSSIKDILTNKSDEWKYEFEYRYISNTKEKKIKVGKITKIHFGIPYKHLSNFQDILKKNDKLREYYERKQELEEFCKQNNIEIKDFYLKDEK